MVDSNKIKQMIDFATKSESKQRLDAMIDLAKSEPGIVISTDRLDKDSYLFNCKNGTLNLKTGKLQPYKRSDYLTHINEIKFDPKAECSEWEKFINKITDENKYLKDYLQRIAGYSLTGDVKEQCLFILYGSGANGKTTFIEILKKLLGEYSVTMNIQNLGRHNNNDAKYELARLLNKRLVSTSEPESDFGFSEALIKILTGGDKISCRFMHCNPFEYYPTHKTFILCNYLPNIKGNDHGIWRRIRLIPFDVRIPKEEQDKDLLNKLQDELPGILNWAVKGCLEWQNSGLNAPKIVTDAVNSYKDEMDIIGDFISDCCISDASKTIGRGLLYNHYKKWCNNKGIIEEIQRNFNCNLENRGYKADRTTKSRIFRGITIKDLES